MSSPHEIELGITDPIQVYPLLEQAIRTAAGRDLDEQISHFATMWAAMSIVASGNPFAWDRHRYSTEEVANVTPDNRMVGFPYTKLCNSNERVDQAAALLVMSLDMARELGIHKDRCIFISAIAEGLSPSVSERFDLSTSPAATAAARALLATTGVGVDEIAYFDLYSCFPSAVQLQAEALRVELEPALTVTGGMRFAGGPWRNYTMHAIATAVEKLRSDGDALALVSANGGYSTKISMGLYSTSPLPTPFDHIQAEPDPDERRIRSLDTNPSGPATVETYTVMHGRHGEPVEGILTCLMPDGRRAWGRTIEPSALAGMIKEDIVGRPLTLTPEHEAHIE
jgi:acetyl-CoA C-acetyltransferase